MKRGNLLILCVCLILIMTTIPVKANTDLVSKIENEEKLIQSKFTNISVFSNDFYITDQGKAVLTSYVEARNVDECTISMYLQKYQDGKWVTIKHWSATESGTFCGIGKTWYVTSGYQYRLKSYTYVYMNQKQLESSSFESKKIIY